MKNKILITLFTIGLIAPAISKAEPLVYTESTRAELQNAYKHKDVAGVFYEYAQVEIERFCRNAGAHSSPTQWSICVDAVESMVLGQKMERLAEIQDIHDYALLSGSRY